MPLHDLHPVNPLEHPTRLSGKIDRIGLAVMVFGLCFCFFYLFWGSPLPSAAAGGALAMLWLRVIHLARRRKVHIRETVLRRRVGGQAAVDALLLATQQEASDSALRWLAGAGQPPITGAARANGACVALRGGERLYLLCLRKHPASKAGREDVLEALRGAKAADAAVCVLCSTSPFSSEAAQMAEAYQPPQTARVRLVGRDALIQLAGQACPATDEQMDAMGRRKRRAHFDAKRWRAQLVQPAKAKRYAAYGLGMLAMLLIFRQWIYCIPATVCLALFCLSLREKPKGIEI